MSKNDKNKLIITIVAVLAIILIVGGATYAYWTWTTSEEQQTNVTIKVGGGELNITGTNVTNTGMYPTASCDGSAALKGSATVTAVNDTATNMTATLKLRAALYAAQGTLTGGTTGNQAHLHWAIVDTTSTTTKTCSSPDAQGTLADVTAATSSANFPNTTYTDIDTTISFTADANKTTTKTYDVYVWLDKDYEYTNTGTTVSDPMQNLSISVRWSQASTLVQS